MRRPASYLDLAGTRRSVARGCARLGLTLLLTGP